MEKVNIYGLDGKSKGLIEKSKIFSIKPRKDLIRKASKIYQSKNKQIQGRDKRAGLRNTAEGWGTGHELSRAPRLKGSGYPTARNVARVPFARGGRGAHVIVTKKKIKKNINKKTYRLSILSAISASGDIALIKEKGHIIEHIPEVPLVIDDKIQTIRKTEQIYTTLCDLGLKEELIKIKKSKKIRSGKGKRRGRKYKRGKGILIVIKDDFGITKASRNIFGVEIIRVEDLSIEDLAPGGEAGRLIIWTQAAFNELTNKYEELI
ncbi:MAG: 50S ribosomal protein L4 [Promethearchaeota archaeon]|nr:MAG: 50S ribosomal protein L4 [Candidatus Lokiarchaeota archaeon]